MLFCDRGSWWGWCGFKPVIRRDCVHARLNPGAKHPRQDVALWHAPSRKPPFILFTSLFLSPFLSFSLFAVVCCEMMTTYKRHSQRSSGQKGKSAMTATFSMNMKLSGVLAFTHSSWNVHFSDFMMIHAFKWAQWEIKIRRTNDHLSTWTLRGPRNKSTSCF